MSNALTSVIAMAAIFVANAVLAGEGHDHGHDHDHGHAHDETVKSTNTTTKLVLKVKDIALVEVIHDLKEGKITISVMDGKKKALAPEKAPRLNLMVDKKRKQLKTTTVKGETAKFEVTDDVLKSKLNGKLAIKFADKTHQIPLDAHANCDHDHGKGHGHAH